MVVVSKREAAYRAVRVGAVDGARHTQPDRQRDSTPVCPTRTAKSAEILSIVVGNRDACTMLVVGVRVEERDERSVGARTHMRRDSSRTIAPRPSVRLLDLVEFPVSWIGEGGIGECCGENQEEEQREADLPEQHQGHPGSLSFTEDAPLLNRSESRKVHLVPEMHVVKVARQVFIPCGPGPM